jgi:hypothetical protein
MSQEARFALVVALVLGAAVIGLWQAWQRGSRAKTKLRDQHSAKLARYALAKSRPDVVAPRNETTAKAVFGRR